MLADHVDNMRDSFTRAQIELRGLRLVGSSTLVELLDEFVQNQEAVVVGVNAGVNAFINRSLSDPGDVFSPDLIEKINRNSAVLDKLVTQTLAIEVEDALELAEQTVASSGRLSRWGELRAGQPQVIMSVRSGRGGRIRTADILLPKQD